MLSNFQLGNQALLQSFLVGQPELREKLQSPALEQLRQRVIASCHLGPMSEDETARYIEHRLKRVGWNGRPSFSPEALTEVHRHTGGIPRRINLLCTRLLLAAFLDGNDTIDQSRVERVAAEVVSEMGGLHS
jgi:type II secretory pathway predicted ATPase ExeA